MWSVFIFEGIVVSMSLVVNWWYSVKLSLVCKRLMLMYDFFLDCWGN